ncbi:hypothetical protein [Brevibacterium sp. VCM10]|uniref:hypothetical protein n=1 Tax=Brevibacterium sp. VCM10 TaxID=1381751 RepID=UPI0004B46FD7|nr:hypothetical protein [Brevibacterium sp. VCM10]
MRTYKVTTLAGQVLTIKATGITFAPGHVAFSADETLVRALSNQTVVEIREADRIEEEA